MVEDERGSAFDVSHPPPERLGHVIVVGVEGMAGAWQMEVAPETNIFFLGSQSVLADTARAWRDEVHDPSEHANLHPDHPPYLSPHRHTDV